MSRLNTENIGRAGGSSVPTNTVLQGTAKAWFNLNGTGTISPRDDFNVSSYVDNGVGDYTSNFATAMPNANYCANMMTGDFGNGFVIRGATVRDNTLPTTGLLRYGTRNTTVDEDQARIMVSIQGDPA